MFPSKKHPSYGTFVREFVSGLEAGNRGGTIEVVAICGRTKNVVTKLYKYLVFYMNTMRLLIVNKYDIIYVHTILLPIFPLLAVSVFKRLPIVFNVHGIDVLSKGKMSVFLRKLSLPLLEKALMIVVPSTYFKRIVLKQFPRIDEYKIFVSPSGGIDTVFFRKPSPKDTSNQFTMGFLSRIGEGKGWDIFVKAIELLQERGVNCNAIIAGRGPQQNALKRMLAKSSASSCIRFIDLTLVKHDQLPLIYQQMDLFVFPTYYYAESLGLVGIEAMACGLPVIGSRIGALESYLIDGYNGFLFEAKSVNDLADKVQCFLSLSDRQKKEMADHAYKTACQYDKEYVTQQLLEKLQSLI